MVMTSARTTRVVLDRHVNPFERLTPTEQRRLLVRVLCELVAYDEPDAVTDSSRDERLAG
jgi:hypothetical protein